MATESACAPIATPILVGSEKQVSLLTVRDGGVEAQPARPLLRVLPGDADGGGGDEDGVRGGRGDAPVVAPETGARRGEQGLNQEEEEEAGQQRHLWCAAHHL